MFLKKCYFSKRFPEEEVFGFWVCFIIVILLSFRSCFQKDFTYFYQPKTLTLAIKNTTKMDFSLVILHLIPYSHFVLLCHPANPGVLLSVKTNLMD